MRSKRLCTRLSDDDFLSFDGPTGVTVLPDGSRQDFFHHLGLREHNYRHMALYRKMRTEAQAGMDRLFESRDSLQPELVQDLNVQPPYSLKQITEVAFQSQVEMIYRCASKQTQGFYEINQQQDGMNWVIRWMLWRVIRAHEIRDPSVSSTVAESTVSACSSSTAEYPGSSVRTDLTSPTVWWMQSAASPHGSSDSEDWIEHDAKEKAQIQQHSDKLRGRKRSYWDHVMNT